VSDGKGGNGGVVRDEDETLPADADQPGEQATGLTPVEPALTREAFDALQRERDELRDQLLRRRADFENFKRRVERDRQLAGQEAVASILQSLVPVLDDFDRALEATGPDASLRAGVELIRRQVLTMLESSGVVTQDPLGQPFDPEHHQALSYEATPGVEDGTVVAVFRKAYFLGGRLLRPALVKVAKGEAPGENDG
jgi:molecular chaperone GrpE